MANSAFTPAVLTVSSGTGSGSGEKNYITNPSMASATTGWNVVGDFTLTRTTAASELPREYTTATGIKLVANNSTTQSAADYLYFDFNLDDVDLNRKLKIQWSQKKIGALLGTHLAVVITSQSDRTTALYTPVTSAIPGIDGDFQTSFDSASTASLSLVIRGTGTDIPDNVGICLSDVIVGPGEIVQGAAISEWQSYTPTGSWSTNVNYSGWYRRTGSSMDWRGKVAATATLSGTTQLTMTLPLNLTVTSSGLTTNGRSFLGKALVTTSSSTRRVLAFCYASNGSNNITFEYHSQNANTDTTLNTVADVSQTTPFTMNNGDFVEGYIEGLPIAEWAGNGTVNLGPGAQVEYAATSGTWNADSSTTVYGPGGVQMGGALTAFRTKTVTFQYPIQADDQIFVEASPDQIIWFPINGSTASSGGGSVVPSFNSTGSFSSGVTWFKSSATAISVLFAQYALMANDDLPIGDWSSTFYWRVRKAKASSPVGFGLAGTDGSAGLYKPGQAPGQATNTTIGSGYIGERLSSNSVGVNVAATTAYANICSVTLTPGVWCVSAQYSLGLGTITGWTYCQVNISTSSSTNDSNNNGGFVAYIPGSSTSNTGSPYTGSVGNRFISVASGSTTPVYLVGRIDYTTQSSSTWTVNNRIDAVRIA